MMPSPHLLATQRSPRIGQDQPGSTWHVAEQPSLLFVFLSSHFSSPPILPSPHLTVETHGDPGVGQTKSASSCWQVAMQPSPATVLPSSQISPGSSTPSPQMGFFMLMPQPAAPAHGSPPVPP